MKGKASHSSFLKQLAIGWLLINLLIVVLGVFSIRESCLQYEENAAVTTQNLSKILEEYIGGVIRNADVALQTVGDEAEKQLATGGINRRIINTYLVRQKERVKETDSFRMSDEKGFVLYGTEVVPSAPIHVADRDYFIVLSNNSKIGMSISKPILGRISHKWVLVIARRINKPDGSFAGVVYSGILLENFSETFSKINTGKNGSVILVDDKGSVICRYPERIGIGSAVGIKVKSPEFIKFLETGEVATTFRARATLDGVERMLTYRRISSYPLYAGVGLAKDDYLSGWRGETKKMLAMLFLFFLISLGLAWMIYRYITQRRQAEKEIRMVSRNNELILTAVGEGICGIDLEGKITLANPAAAEMCGYQVEKLIGAQMHSLLHYARSDGSPYPQEECPHFLTIRQGKSFQARDEVFWRKDGTSFYVAYTSTPVSERDEITGAVIAFRDITKRKLAEEALQESESLLRESQNIAGLGSYILDISTGLWTSSEVLDRLFGIDESYERSVDGWTAIIHPDDQTIMAEYFRNEVVGKSHDFDKEYRIVRQDDQVERLVHGLGKLEFDSQGRPSKMKGTIQDITERKNLEEQLRQAQKMEAIGTLAGGVAHDFNNILTAIIGFGQMAQNRIKDDEQGTKFIEEVLAAAGRAAELTNSLLAFSRKQTIELKQVDLNEIVRKVNKMLMRVIGEDIKLTMTLISRELAVMADTGQIEQILLNLATNARDAMPGGGELILQTGVVNVDSSYAEAHLFENTGLYAVLTVSDTGIGMDKKTRENIFEPFFTTKEIGKGTGLGLAMVYGIVKQHGGNINVYSEPGKGTIFRIYLPIVTTKPEAEPETAQPVPLGRGETILLAEDDPQVRNVTSMYLQNNGYKVIEAENGKEAIKSFLENENKIAIVLLDVIMPIKNGWDVYKEMQGIEPDIKTIFLSGYTDDIIARKGILEDGINFISKPINPDTLMRKIREVLDS